MILFLLTKTKLAFLNAILTFEFKCLQSIQNFAPHPSHNAKISFNQPMSLIKQHLIALSAKVPTMITLHHFLCITFACTFVARPHTQLIVHLLTLDVVRWRSGRPDNFSAMHGSLYIDLPADWTHRKLCDLAAVIRDAGVFCICGVVIGGFRWVVFVLGAGGVDDGVVGDAVPVKIEREELNRFVDPWDYRVGVHEEPLLGSVEGNHSLPPVAQVSFESFFCKKFEKRHLCLWG